MPRDCGHGSSTRHQGRGWKRSRLLRELSAVLGPFLAALLDPKARPGLRHADREHLAGLAAVTVYAMRAGSMQIESGCAVESLVTGAAFAATAGEFVGHDGPFVFYAVHASFSFCPRPFAAVTGGNFFSGSR